jgi:hypothetical protein
MPPPASKNTQTYFNSFLKKYGKVEDRILRHQCGWIQRQAAVASAGGSKGRRRWQRVGWRSRIELFIYFHRCLYLGESGHQGDRQKAFGVQIAPQKDVWREEHKHTSALLHNKSL